MNEAELVFTGILNCDRLHLYLEKDLPLARGKSSLISSVLKRRIRGEPIQYILAKTEFMGLEFMVNSDVFIPRPETEILVETVIEKARRPRSPEYSKTDIIDVGTGSGCIAVSLAKLLSCVNITASDVSDEALEVARYNAQLNNCSGKIKLIKSDLFAEPELSVAVYDIIVSNPPYVINSDIQGLQREIKFEPRLALDGGHDGLSFYRRIIPDSARHLKEDGFLIMELGFNQINEVRHILKISGEFQVTEVLKDYNNIDRIIVAQKIKRT